MGVDDAGDRDPAARELLDDHRVGRQVEAHPAVLLGDRHPEEAELLHLLDDRLGELVLVVVVLGVGDDLLVDELVDHLGDGLLLVGLRERLGGDGHVRVISPVGWRSCAGHEDIRVFRARPAGICLVRGCEASRPRRIRGPRSCAGLALAVPATALAMPPLVRTNPAANVGGQSATLKGTVTPRGKTTEFFFAYGTTKAYGQRSPTQTVGAGNGAQQVSQTVGGLRVGTQYHFRIVATNPDGTSSGGDRAFRTRPPDPNALLLTEQPNPLLFGHSAALSGQLLGPQQRRGRRDADGAPGQPADRAVQRRRGADPDRRQRRLRLLRAAGDQHDLPRGRGHRPRHRQREPERRAWSTTSSSGASHTRIHSGSVVTFSGSRVPRRRRRGLDARSSAAAAAST